ncbi:MAG TPA: M1 family metallopeptidase [Chitinophagaceae bacterium]|nr:M1 family metallopeptidase [Chitinophagaceae bacterium]
MKKPFFLFILASHYSFAQTQLPVPLNIKPAYKKETRSNNGNPGKNYWQNFAEYNIQVNFNPDNRLLSGTEEISYVNNSPDTLKQILFKLYPNIYKKGAKRDIAFEAADLTDGVSINKMNINGEEKGLSNLKITGTNMIVNGVFVLPKQTIHFSIGYSYTLNQTSHLRTGEIEPGAAFIAYFFPRIAVYDDIDGWDRNEYTGNKEFYNDFCNYNVSITVPDNYLVWATGELQNCSEILMEKYCDRLTKAEKNDDVVFIVDENDLRTGNITKQNAFNTWKFKATNVVDFAFAVSNHYVWNSTSVVVDNKTGRRTRVDAIFNTGHKDYLEIINYARKTVDLMSHYFPKWPFPYSHISVFDGLDQMEYPMMANDNPLSTKLETITLTDHEIFHTMFPFYMGINETKYGWMDEGWATIGEWLLSPKIDSTIEDNYGIDATEKNSGSETDAPITTLTTQQTGTTFFINSYPKPALGYLFVKDMLGDELFYKGLHYYIQQWNGKHPIPFDFFNCMNTGSGKNINWFWKRWFFDPGYPDLAIKSLTDKESNKQIVIETKGNKPVPIDVNIVYSDGSKQNIHKNVSVWEDNKKTVTINFTSAKKIKKIELGSLLVPDVNKKDNVWESK